MVSCAATYLAQAGHMQEALGRARESATAAKHVLFRARALIRLGEVLALPNGIPSRDCIRRVLSALQPEAFQQCFQQWVESFSCAAWRPMQTLSK